jgi:hypothetical protein
VRKDLIMKHSHSLMALVIGIRGSAGQRPKS